MRRMPTEHAEKMTSGKGTRNYARKIVTNHISLLFVLSVISLVDPLGAILESVVTVFFLKGQHCLSNVRIETPPTPEEGKERRERGNSQPSIITPRTLRNQLLHPNPCFLFTLLQYKSSPQCRNNIDHAARITGHA